ncbi:MAG: hypothetical protein ACR2LR_26140 [Hassallia sp.]
MIARTSTGSILALRDRTRIIPFEKLQNSGTIQWAQPLVGILLDASSDVYEYISNQIMKNRLRAVAI